MAHRGMKFGIFLAPFHRVGENPTLALNRDMELIEWLDYLGYDEVWIGEHHSASWELIASPEIFIGAAGARSTSCSARGCRCTWRRSAHALLGVVSTLGRLPKASPDHPIEDLLRQCIVALCVYAFSVRQL